MTTASNITLIANIRTLASEARGNKKEAKGKLSEIGREVEVEKKKGQSWAQYAEAIIASIPQKVDAVEQAQEQGLKIIEAEENPGVPRWSEALEEFVEEEGLREVGAFTDEDRRTFVRPGGERHREIYTKAKHYAYGEFVGHGMHVDVAKDLAKTAGGMCMGGWDDVEAFVLNVLASRTTETVTDLDENGIGEDAPNKTAEAIRPFVFPYLGVQQVLLTSIGTKRKGKKGGYVNKVHSGKLMAMPVTHIRTADGTDEVLVTERTTMVVVTESGKNGQSRGIHHLIKGVKIKALRENVIGIGNGEWRLHTLEQAAEAGCKAMLEQQRQAAIANSESESSTPTSGTTQTASATESNMSNATTNGVNETETENNQGTSPTTPDTGKKEKAVKKTLDKKEVATLVAAMSVVIVNEKVDAKSAFATSAQDLVREARKCLAEAVSTGSATFPTPFARNQEAVDGLVTYINKDARRASIVNTVLMVNKSAQIKATIATIEEEMEKDDSFDLGLELGVRQIKAQLESPTFDTLNVPWETPKAGLSNLKEIRTVAKKNLVKARAAKVKSVDLIAHLEGVRDAVEAEIKLGKASSHKLAKGAPDHVVKIWDNKVQIESFDNKGEFGTKVSLNDAQLEAFRGQVARIRSDKDALKAEQSMLSARRELEEIVSSEGELNEEAFNKARLRFETKAMVCLAVDAYRLGTNPMDPNVLTAAGIAPNLEPVTHNSIMGMEFGAVMTMLLKTAFTVEGKDGAEPTTAPLFAESSSDRERIVCIVVSALRLTSHNRTPEQREAQEQVLRSRTFVGRARNAFGKASGPVLHGTISVVGGVALSGLLVVKSAYGAVKTMSSLAKAGYFKVRSWIAGDENKADFQAKASECWNAFTSVWSGVHTKVWDRTKAAYKSCRENVVVSIAGAVLGAVGGIAVAAIAGPVVGFVAGAAGLISGAIGADTLSRDLDTDRPLGSIWDNISTRATSAWETTRDFVKSAPSRAWEAIKSVPSRIASAATSAWGWVTGLFSSEDSVASINTQEVN